MEYTENEKKGISSFILQYLLFTVGNGTPIKNDELLSDDDIQRGIGMMITSNVFSAIELRKSMLRETDILISEQFINECVESSKPSNKQGEQ